MSPAGEPGRRGPPAREASAPDGQDGARTKAAKGETKKKKKKGGGLLVGLLVSFFVLAALGAGAAAGGYYWLDHTLDAPGPTTDETVVAIAPGSGLNAIAAKLEAEGYVPAEYGRYIVRAGAVLEGAERSLKAGEYAVPAHASVRDIIAILSSGRVVEYPITFAEGLTSKQIVDIINAADVLTGEIAEVPREGSLLPETYRVPRGMSRQALLDRMAGAQADLLDEVWPNRAEGLPYASVDEAIIAASIVEKETGRADERGKVAAVVRNRLERPMRLQMDSTIIYGEWLEDQSRPLNVEPLGPELDRPDNPYNTYEHDGLPPGPIANPGRDAIEATLNPEPTADGERPILYFIASCEGEGRHNFASSLNQHERYRAEWRRCRNALRAAANEAE